MSVVGFDIARLEQVMSASVANMGTAINANLTVSGLVIVRHRLYVISACRVRSWQIAWWYRPRCGASADAALIQLARNPLQCIIRSDASCRINVRVAFLRQR